MVRFALRRRPARAALALAAAAALTAAAVSAASASSRHATAGRTHALTTLRVVFDWPGIDFEAVPLTVGNARGYYRQAGLDVQIVIPPTGVPEPGRWSAPAPGSGGPRG